MEKEKAYESFLQFVSDLDFSVPIWPVAELTERAIAHYNDFSYGEPLTAADDVVVTIQICESFLWHDCSNYATLINLYNGTREYNAICAQVKAAIDEAYPDLSEQIKSYCCTSYTQPLDSSCSTDMTLTVGLSASRQTSQRNRPRSALPSSSP